MISTFCLTLILPDTHTNNAALRTAEGQQLIRLCLKKIQLKFFARIAT